MKLLDMRGTKFGRLTVIQRAPNIGHETYWLCKCDCSCLKVVRGTHLRKGLIRSCGCYRQDVSRKHGRHDTPEYHVWQNMLARCRNQNHPSYKDYGGRGITVCERWHTFENFFADMGERPSPDLMIERIDNNGNYEPSNCTWTTLYKQLMNRRNTVIFH